MSIKPNTELLITHPLNRTNGEIKYFFDLQKEQDDSFKKKENDKITFDNRDDLNNFLDELEQELNKAKETGNKEQEKEIKDKIEQVKEQPTGDIK
jgi:excinuclease UvrABC helicase subunit UvrB